MGLTWITPLQPLERFLRSSVPEVSPTHGTHTYTQIFKVLGLYSAKNRENESEALAQDD